MRTSIAQFLGIVEHGLINARHAFRGLKRDLSYDGDMDADQAVVVYLWQPPWDFVWVGDPFSGHIEQKYPPAQRVFAVLVRPEPQPNPYDIYGSVERWNWIREEAPNLRGAPVDWATRYGEKLWSREI